jgi:hypothetical protein
MSESIFDEAKFAQQVERATQAGAIANATEPRAVLAHYDVSNKVVVIQLKSGATFSFPPSIAQGLSGASAENLAAIEITPSGEGLHWEALDADLHVPSLLAGVFGSQSWMADLRSQWQRAS